MAISNVATTELEAVNILLATIGEAPLNTLDGEIHVDAIMAQNTLSAVLKDFQCEAWYFNVEKDFPLTPDTDGFIYLPTNVHNIDLAPVNSRYRDVDVVVRGTKLYDRKNHTYIFTDMIEAEILLILPFDEIPQTAKNYLVVRAARKYQTQVVGSQVLHTYTKEEELRARASFAAENIRNSDRNMLDPHGNSAMGNRSIFYVMRRW